MQIREKEYVLLINTEDSQNQVMKLDLNQWVYHGNGASHIVLKNIDKSDPLATKVLIIPINLPTNPVHQLINQLYQDVLKFQKNINKYLLQKITYPLDHSNQTILCSFLNSKHFLSGKIVFQKIQTIDLSENLFCFEEQNSWDGVIEFKPKAIYPQTYTERQIKTFCDKYKYGSEQIKDYILTMSAIERTRWFKRQVTPKYERQINPYLLFSLSEGHTADFLKRRIEHYDSQRIKQIVDENIYQALNQEINQIIQNTHLLQEIFSLHCLYTNPTIYLQPMGQRIVQGQLDLMAKHTNSDKQNILSKVKASLDLLNQVNYKQMIKQYKPEHLIKQDLIQYHESLEDMLNYLIGITWRDVSFIIKFKLQANNHKIEKYDIKIIDYDLKACEKIQLNVEREDKVLKYYIQYRERVNRGEEIQTRLVDILKKD